MAAVSLGCGKSEPIAIGEVCRNEAGKIVTVEGYLRLPEATGPESTGGDPRDTYTLLLVERPNGTGGFLITNIKATSAREPNRIGNLPLSYTYDNLRVFTDRGNTVSARDRIAVTGKVAKSSDGCELDVLKIDEP